MAYLLHAGLVLVVREGVTAGYYGQQQEVKRKYETE
jgi:hypothetical protein